MHINICTNGYILKLEFMHYSDYLLNYDIVILISSE